MYINVENHYQDYHFEEAIASQWGRKRDALIQAHSVIISLCPERTPSLYYFILREGFFIAL
jgi:hypothetical protein